MSEFRIPKRFKLFGQIITIEYDEGLSREGFDGKSIYSQCKILIKPATEKNEMPQCAVEDTFFHELLHTCLDAAGYGDLSSDEKFVRSIAGLLHQAMTTAEYNEVPESKDAVFKDGSIKVYDDGVVGRV